jgi:hypothetical protein
MALLKAQQRAWYHVKRAIATGKLIRPETCEDCGAAPGVNKRGRSLIEAHHYLGYEPEHYLDVIWLCSACHKQYNGLLDPIAHHSVFFSMRSS